MEKKKKGWAEEIVGLIGIGVIGLALTLKDNPPDQWAQILFQGIPFTGY